MQSPSGGIPIFPRGIGIILSLTSQFAYFTLLIGKEYQKQFIILTSIRK